MTPKLRSLSIAAAITGALAVGNARAADTVTQVQNLGDIVLPTTLVFNHILTTPLPFTLTSADLFYDDYQFNVPASSYSAFASTIDLGNVFAIEGLSVSLFQAPLSTTVTGTVTADLRPVGLTGLAPIATGGPGGFDSIGPGVLTSGTYVFEVSGRATGSNGGAYTGLMNFASPVPEPGLLGLVLTGLGMLSIAARRRRRR